MFLNITYLLHLSSIAFAKETSLLHILNFETGNLNGWNTKWLPHKYSASIVQKPVRSGKYAAKFVLNETDKMLHNGKRSELTMLDYGKIGEEYWYGFSNFLPKDWKKDSQKDIVAQWHSKPDKEYRGKICGPVLAIRIKKEKWVITSCQDFNKITLNKNFSQTKLWKGDFKKGVWTDWVVHIIWSHKDDGLTEI